MNPIEEICFKFAEYVPCIDCPFKSGCGEDTNDDVKMCNEYILYKILKNIKSYYDDWELT